MSKVTDYKLGDGGLLDLLKKQEEELRFPAFDASIARALGEAMRKRFPKVAPSPQAQLYIQIRTAAARPTNPFVLYSALASGTPTTGGNPANDLGLAAGIAYQVDSKANTVVSHGGSTLSAKAFATMMGWEASVMGLSPPEYNVNGGGFPIRLRNCPFPVGIILTSGQPDLLDHQFIVDTLEEFLPTLS